MKGPAIFLAQFAGGPAPFNNLSNLCEWAAGLGYKGIQLPADPVAGLIDLAKAADSQHYCDEICATVADAGLEISELSTHLQGQLVAVHPAYDIQFDWFADSAVRGNPAARTQWAIEQLKSAAKASERMGLTAHATFSGALLWQSFYPWPPRPPGLVEAGFEEFVVLPVPGKDGVLPNARCAEGSSDCPGEFRAGGQARPGQAVRLQPHDIGLRHQRLPRRACRGEDARPSRRAPSAARRPGHARSAPTHRRE